MTKACDWCAENNQYVCEGHCGKCHGMVVEQEPGRIGAGFDILDHVDPSTMNRSVWRRDRDD